MSRRTRARRRQHAPGPSLVAPLIAALLGAGGGGVLAPSVFGRLARPEPVDASKWTVLIPGIDDKVLTPGLGRGTRVGAGELLVVPHSFSRSDRILPRDDRGIALLEVELAPDSGPLLVNLASPGLQGHGIRSIKLWPDHWAGQSQLEVPTPPGQPAVLRNEGGNVAAWTGEQWAPLTMQPVGTIELSAFDGAARLLRVRALDVDGRVVVEDDWTDAPVPTPWRIGAAAAGAVVGLLAGLVLAGAGSWPGGLLLALLLLAPPLLVLRLPHITWLSAVERLFLVRTPTWELAQMVLAAACLPLAAVAATRSGALVAGRARGRGLPWPVWGGLVAVAALVGARDLTGWSWALVIPGAALLAAPAWLAHKGRLPRRDLLLRDLPTLLLVAGLGWGLGLLPAMLWRLLVVVAQVPTLVERAPRAGTDVLFATLLALPLGAELALRHSYLDTGWSSEHLSGAELGAGEDASGVVPYWSESCGTDPKLVWWFGGSSAGGAYQMEGRPADFFPGQVHHALCDRGLAVRTVNFANGGRDTFTFSRALPELMKEEAPDLVVVYVGVNDVLTANSALTRKQREAVRAEEGDGSGLLATLAARSRLVAGLSLLNRPTGGDASEFVSAVPVADAEENLREIIAGVEARGGRVFLVPELTRPTAHDPLDPYRAMEERVAGDEPSAVWLDVVDQTRQLDPDTIFVDRNHLSRAGHSEVALRIAPALTSALDPSSEPIPPEASP